MMRDSSLELIGVEETMWLPLCGRYAESIKPAGRIKDPICEQIVEEMGIDYQAMLDGQHPLTRLAWVARAYNTDLELKRLSRDVRCDRVLSIGCGLDTAYFRSGISWDQWYDLDLENVISARSRLVPAAHNNVLLSGSVLDCDTYRTIPRGKTLIVLALGVLYYFREEEVRQVIESIASLSNEVYLIFDYFSEMGVQVTNQMVIDKVKGARVTWFANDLPDILKLSTRIEAIDAYPMFEKIKPLLTPEETAMANQADAVRFNIFAVMRLNGTGTFEHN